MSRILAIDDHAETLSIVVATLKGHGYDVVGTQSPLKALEAIERVRPDLVLVDMNMPEMEGTEVVKHIRANPRIGHIPIIMFTAMGEVEYKMAGFDAGADDYLTKPTEPAELVERVEVLLGSPANKPTSSGSGGLPSQTSLFENPPESIDLTTKVSAPTGQLIGVMGARGSAGTTTMAINLAVGLAASGQQTTLVDLDLKRGHIALYLNQKTTGFVDMLARMSVSDLRKHLPKLIVPRMKNLQLLLAQGEPNGRFPILSTEQTSALIETVMQSSDYVVVDMGNLYHESQQAILDMANHLMVCFPPERVALATTKRLIEHIQMQILPMTELHAVLFDMQTGVALPQNAVESFLGHPVMGTVSVSRKEMAQAVNRGASLVEAYPKSPLVGRFRELVQQFMTA